MNKPAGSFAALRSRHRRGTLSGAAAAVLSAVRPGWDQSVATQQQNAHITAYQQWMRTHNTEPRTRSTDPAEQAIAQWLNRARNTHRDGTLSDEHTTAIEAAPGHQWSTVSARWNTICLAYAVFLHANGRAPQHTGNTPVEVKLAIWLRRQRTAHKAGRLSAARTETLTNIPGHSWNEATP